MQPYRLICRLFRLVVAAAIVLSVPLPAAALLGDEYGPFGLGGSIRGIGIYLDDNHCRALQKAQDDLMYQIIARLTAAGRPADRIKYEAHLVHAYSSWSSHVLSASGTGGGAATGQLDRGRLYRVVDESWDMLTDLGGRAEMTLDRFNLRYAFDWGDLTVGRQAVTFGKAWFWNPMDVFLPFDPGQFDRDYKAGVDAVRLDVPLGMFSGLTFIAAGGREIGPDGQYADDGKIAGVDIYGSALLARGYTHYKGWDIAVQGGKVYGGYHISAGGVGEVSGVQIRAEAAQFWAYDSPVLPRPFTGDIFETQLSAVFGMGYHFKSSLDLEFEVLYNGGGENDPDGYAQALIRQSHGIIPHLSRWLAGLKFSYEITPLITGNLLLIQSVSDDSRMLQPYMNVSLSDNAELIAGAAFNFGDPPECGTATGHLKSEFGAYPHQFFTEVKLYF